MEKLSVRTFQWGLLTILILRVRSEKEKSNPLLPLIPDVIDQLPPHKIWGEYEGGIPINFGNSITPLQANDTPISIRWIDDQPGRLYVLMMLDMDGPTSENPVNSPVNHWLVGNIEVGKGNSWRRGTVLAVYSRPRPEEGSGLHRYVFLVYEQPGGGMISFSETLIPSGPSLARRNFDYRQFAKKYRLGEPFAANYFQSFFVDGEFN
ncbi:protein D2 [Folsomia candida]|uniref:OV-16 antigen n=1 Tax=Folsomia candida TaxID=158441 RepID=A0A226D8W0_FOLCA|nr:protein D2 [Folsomia candida]OXA41294.1 OV-16 antigen [Folsomia candida]